jgi:signal transduction histidine kinase
MIRRSALAGLLLLTLGPVPLVGWLGERALRSIEGRHAELNRQETLAELGEDLTAALLNPSNGPGYGSLPLRHGLTSIPLLAGATEIALTPAGEALADPAVMRARVLAREDRVGEALEVLQPLFAHSDPLRRAVGYLEAAEVLRGAGRSERGLELARRGEAVLEEVDSEPWSRWAHGHVQLLGGESPLASTKAWIDEVETRATTLEELVLLGSLLARFPAGDPRAAALVEILDERMRWPEWRRLLLPRVAARPPGSSPSLLPTPRGWFLVKEGSARRIESLEEWLASWRGEEGARARLPSHEPPERGDRFESIELSTWTGAERGSIDLGDLTVEVAFAEAELFGSWNPRWLLFAGLAAYAALAILALRAFRSRERHASALALARGDLIAEVTHELRTPLTILRLYAESLAAGRVPEGSEGEYLRTIERETIRLGALVDRVAEAAREEDVTPAELSILDPVPIVERVAGDFQSTVKASGGSITFEARGEARIHGNREELRRIVEILVDNAQRYSPPPARLEIETFVESGRWVATIRDHGPGIPAAEREQIFERWVRGRGATGRGAGMGLYLARRGADTLGGELRLESPEEGGVRARLELPLRGEMEEGEA